jgi:putative glutathione S-transferase
MGVLINGEWQRDDAGFHVDPSKQAGTFYTPHEHIEVEGGGRYVLYVAAGCPWAARAWMSCCATGMDVSGALRVVRVFPANQEDGWFFQPVSESEHRVVRESGADVQWDRTGGFTHLHQVYAAGGTASGEKVTGRVTVPLLLDSKTGRCISSESEDIVSILLGRFAPLHATPCPGMYPLAKKEEIHGEIKILTKEINSLVYGIHFAKTQAAFEDKMDVFFARLTHYENILRQRPWILPDSTEPSVLDLILFATIVRFDIAYGTRFRMTQLTIRKNFPALWHHCCRVYKVKGIKRAVQFPGILCMYYRSLPLVMKAGVTTGLLNVNYEQDLAAGGLVDSHYGGAEGAGEDRFSMWPFVASFVVGVGVGAAVYHIMSPLHVSSKSSKHQ